MIKCEECSDTGIFVGMSYGSQIPDNATPVQHCGNCAVVDGDWEATKMAAPKGSTFGVSLIQEGSELVSGDYWFSPTKGNWHDNPQIPILGCSSQSS